MSWTDERVARLKKLWLDGRAEADIATELGGVTRNAVIGKAHRLGLSRKNTKRVAGDAESKQQTVASEPQQTAEQSFSDDLTGAEADTEGVTGEATDPATVIEGYHETAKKAEEESLKLHLMELNERTCKWPIGDPATNEFWFCGRPSEAGKPYCEPHNNVAAQPVTSRRDRKPQNKPNFASFSRT